MPVNVPGTTTWSNVQSPIAGEVNSAPALNATTITPLVNRTNYLKNITEPHTGTGVERHKVLIDISPAYNSLRSITGMTTGDGFWVQDSATGSLDFFVYDATSGLTENVPNVIRSGSGAWVNAKRNPNPRLEQCVSSEIVGVGPEQYISSDPGSPTAIQFFSGAAPDTVTVPTSAIGQMAWIVELDMTVSYDVRISGSWPLAVEFEFSLDGGITTNLESVRVFGNQVSGYPIQPSGLWVQKQEQFTVRRRFFFTDSTMPSVIKPMLKATKNIGDTSAHPDAAVIRTLRASWYPNRVHTRIFRVFP